MRMTLMTFVAAIAGCAGDAELRSTLDDRGLTWITSDLIVTFARSAPRFSAAARDYAYLAPVERNDMGTRRHFLWLGLGSTIDRPWNWGESSSPVTLVLVLDGEPVALPLAPWEGSEDMSRHASTPVYQTQRARISLDQLEHFANAESIEIELIAENGAAARYELWDGTSSDWHTFVAGVQAR